MAQPLPLPPLPHHPREGGGGRKLCPPNIMHCQIASKFVCNITTNQKKWLIIKLKSTNYFLETEKMLYCTQ